MVVGTEEATVLLCISLYRWSLVFLNYALHHANVLKITRLRESDLEAFLKI